jgi:hypothetical protein
MSARLATRRPNGLELSCPAARATAHPFSRHLPGKEPTNLPHASRVSCSALLGGDQFYLKLDGTGALRRRWLRA